MAQCKVRPGICFVEMKKSQKNLSEDSTGQGRNSKRILCKYKSQKYSRRSWFVFYSTDVLSLQLHTQSRFGICTSSVTIRYVFSWNGMYLVGRPTSLLYPKLFLLFKILLRGELSPAPMIYQ
jgi:hypothetical protein